MSLPLRLTPFFQNPPTPMEDFGPFENKFLSHLEQVQSRMASLPTMEPILELLREVVATAATAATSIEPGNLRMKKDDEWRDGAAIWCILMLFWKNQTLNFPKSEIPTKILLWGSFLMKYCLVPLLNLPRRCAFEIYLISILPKQKIVVLHEDSHFWQLCSWVQTCQVRNEDVEGKVFLLENMSAVPEDSSFFWAPCRDWDCKGKGFEGKVKLLGFFMMQVDFWGLILDSSSILD